MEKIMKFKRYLFFTLILFLIIFSISFVSASENSTNDINLNKHSTLSISDVDMIDENLAIKSDSINATS
jgi:hypothetical protein